MKGVSEILASSLNFQPGPKERFHEPENQSWIDDSESGKPHVTAHGSPHASVHGVPHGALCDALRRPVHGL
jgi:hypothetical protein